MARPPRRLDLTRTTSDLFHRLVRFSEVCREGKRISLVTTPGRCFFIIAQRDDCRCGDLVSLNLLDGTMALFL
jgi:hypothetical protein